MGEISHGRFLLGTWQLRNQIVKIDTLLGGDFSILEVFKGLGIGVVAIFSNQHNRLTGVVAARKGDFFFTFGCWAHTSDNHIDFTRGQGWNQSVPRSFYNERFLAHFLSNLLGNLDIIAIGVLICSFDFDSAIRIIILGPVEGGIGRFHPNSKIIIRPSYGKGSQTDEEGCQ